MYTKNNHPKKQTIVAAFTLTIICVFSSFSTQAQSSYDKAWEKINECKLDSAIVYFTEASKDSLYRENALLSLSMLYTQQNEPEKSSEIFNEFMKIAENPYPGLFALWFDGGVVGMNLKKEDYQYELLEALSETENPLSRAVLYRLYLHYVFSNDMKESKVYAQQLQTLKNWSVVGPFDNVVNSGFNKNFGVISNPQPDAKFISKFGPTVKWLKTPVASLDGYYFKGTNFLSDNSLIYAQTFVQSETEQTVVVSLGYSGSLKLWLNDQIIYSEGNRRRTELDFYQIKVKLNKGYNRFLVQLGDYDEPTANFSIRLLDTSGKALNLAHTANFQEYQKKLELKEAIPHFALDYFEKQIEQNENDLLSKILLAKAHMRGLEINKAEELYKNILQEHPHNFFALKNLVLLYAESGNTTNQSKYYGILEETVPHLSDILSNEADEAYENKDEKNFEYYSGLFLTKYHSDYNEQLIAMKNYFLDEDYPKYISHAESFYRNFPDDYSAMVTYYTIQKDYYKKYYSAITVLEKYLKNNYNYAVTEELANLYIGIGEHEKAYKLFERLHDAFPYEKDVLKKQVYILYQDKKFAKTEEICQQILLQAPLDYGTTADISNLAIFMEDKEKALEYLKKTNSYFPFNFDTNEKIRSLQGKKK